MVIPQRLIKSFWELDRKMDADRLSKQTYPTDLTEICDIPYIDDGHEYHKLDVYYPQGTKKGAKLPVIIDIHGGGWFYGDKELNKNYCLHLAQRGFCVFNISYRLVPEVRNDAQLADCMAALDFIGRNLAKYPADKKRVFVTGDSAGGQLAAFVAAACLSDNMRRAYGNLPKPNLNIKAVGLVSPCPYLTPKGGFRFYSPHVLGKNYRRKDWAKYTDFEKTVRAAKGKYPPTIIFTSFADIIAKSQSKKAYRLLKSRGTKAVLDMRFKPSLNHVYQVLYPDSADSVKAIDKMIKFFRKHS
ncbi:MAG: alpha/beta hydrolase [Clostridiales bacterium]|nr:alpha/beta hydrolase [Clostridiales bacterium]